MKPKLNCVLLIDDDMLTNSMNRIIIDHANCANYVIRKISAVTALKYILDSARKNNSLPFPDIIFLDISMPDHTGWDFMNDFIYIKDRLPGKPIIYMLSSYGKDHSLRIENTSDLAGICEKPLTSKLLHSIIDKHFVCA